MSDNARFHNKLHRKNHHTVPTPGYPDSATDPIASASEPFMGDFNVVGNLNVSGALNTTFNTFSNINIPTPVLSATIGFKPTNSLIVQLSGTQYAIPVTLVGPQGVSAPSILANTLSGNTTFFNSVSVLGSILGTDSNNWNSTYTTVGGNSAQWKNGFAAYTNLSANSGFWNSTYTTLCANSAIWSNNFYATQAYTLQPVTSAINTVAGSNSVQGLFSNIGGGCLNQALSAFNTVNGGYNNITSGCYSNIAGGRNNISCGYISTVGGGWLNTSSGNYSTVTGGKSNCASNYATVVGGGFGNVATGNASIVGGGSQNTASGLYSNIGGGYNNKATGNYSYVGGGFYNSLSGICSAILGGGNNTLSANNSFIMGSGITTNTPNYTFVNNISSQCLVQASSAFSGFLNVGPSNVGTTLPGTVAQFFSNNNYYSQINYQNTNSGAYASTDIVITADNGNDTQNYLDIGINSSTYATTAYNITGPNDAYIYAQSNNIAIGTASNSNILFHTGGTLASNERMRVTSSGYVGIGTSAPSSTLTVVGNISASGNVYFNNTIYKSGVSQGSIQPTNGSNSVSNIYSNIGGGCYNVAIGVNSTIAGGAYNHVNYNYSSVLGGCYNIVNGIGSIVGGGSNNRTFIDYASILGGSNNTACCYSVTVGGCNNSNTGAYSFIGGGCNNTNSGAYNVVGGGYNNINNGCCYTFIAGGCQNNILNTVCNSYILGSGIYATCSGYTYTNGIIANGTINTNCACITNLYSTNLICTPGTLSAFCAVAYNAFTCDSCTNRNSTIGGNLYVSGGIYSPFFSSLTGTGSFVLSGGSKYSTIFGNNGLSSFNINHNLNTSDIVMTIVDLNTYQVVYPTIVISNNTQIQVNFSFVPQSTYKISIIGL